MTQLRDIHFRIACKDDLPELYALFLLAFGDYSFDVFMSAKDFEQRLFKVGFEPSISVVAEMDGRIVGFVLHGQGFWGGCKTAYNAGTGVIPMFRGIGLTKAMYNFVRPVLERNGFHQCLLEVLVDNAPALEVYRKVGFRISRTLLCLSQQHLKTERSALKGLQLISPNIPDWAMYQSINGSRLSWQNTWPSIARGVEKGKELIVEAYYKSQWAGVVIFDKTSGKISVLWVGNPYRRKGIGKSLVIAAQKLSTTRLSVLNLDAYDKGTEAFFVSMGFNLFAKQFEMLYLI